MLHGIAESPFVEPTARTPSEEDHRHAGQQDERRVQEERTATTLLPAVGTGHEPGRDQNPGGEGRPPGHRRDTGSTRQVRAHTVYYGLQVPGGLSHGTA
jgi:hypothetical protein